MVPVTLKYCILIVIPIYDMIEEFNVDSKAGCRQLHLTQVARKKFKRRN